MVQPSLRFGRFELQPHERRLLADGEPVPLGARAFDVLACLATQPGRLVTKQALLDTVWAGVVVEEANLAVQVSTLRKVLGGDAIATIPGRGYRFVASVQAEGPATVSASAVSMGPDAAPAPSHSLVGRDDDLQRVAAALAEPGCVTLTGVAGVGKTSLARAVAGAWAAGSVWLDLAPLDAGANWLGALARALQRPLDDHAEVGLARAVASRLLVVDNAEHLIGDTALHIARLIEAEPGLRVLVTSQLPLTIRTERVLPLAPLALTAGDDANPAPAVALFVARVRQLNPRFTVDDAARPLVEELCRRLDGLPLALEMAAARVPMLGLRGVLDALSDRFALLTHGFRDAASRHRTLRAALDWSHALLTAEEQRLYRALGVCAGGFTLDLAVALASNATCDRWQVIDTLSTLVERSLVDVGPEDPPRYRLLETMRAHALVLLQAAGDGEDFRRRHARAMLELYTGAVASNAPLAQRALAIAEHDNVREALAWARVNDPALAVGLAPAVTIAATFTPWRALAAQWLEETAAVIDDPSVPAAARAAWWGERARQQLMNRKPGARSSAARARELFAELGDDLGIFNATSALVRATSEADADLQAHCEAMQALIDRHPEWPLLQRLILAGTRAAVCSRLGDEEGALEHRRAEVALARACGRPQGADAAETNVAAALIRLGRAGEALAHTEALLARIGREDTINAAYAWRYHVIALLECDRHAEARAALPQLQAVHRRCGIALPREPQVVLLALDGRLADALRLGAHAGSRHGGLEAFPALTIALAQARAALGPVQTAQLEAEGATLDDAAACQLFDDSVPGPSSGKSASALG